jgi:adenylate cyclase
MTESHPARRLVAIVVADIVGYARLMEKDEPGTLSRLRAIMSDVVEPKTTEFRGRIVKTTGDGWLSEFGSVTDAVRSTVEIQAAMPARNAGMGKEEELRLRAGIHLGEIIVAGDDIYGTGVNVAARLESIAEPGGICISNLVYDQVQSTLDLDYRDMGEQTVKNISRPVRTFAISERGSHGKIAPPPDVELGTRAGEGASIAVLPFSNLSNDPDQDYFADGMVEDIITALSRFKSLLVIARNSAFTYKGRAVDIREVARKLAVRYVLEGSVRKAGARVRITAQLIEAATGTHLWADRFDGALEDVFDLQDKITEIVVGIIEPQIRKAEIKRSRRKPPENLDAYELVLQGINLRHRAQIEDDLMARGMFEQAVSLDPDYAFARVQLALAHLQQFFWDDSPVALDKAQEIAEEALRIDDTEAWSHMVLAVVHTHRRNFELAIRHGERACALNPGDAGIAAKMGLLLANTGRSDEGIVLIERAMRLNPLEADSYRDYHGIALFSAGRYAEALLSFQVAPNPKYYDHVWMAMCHAQLGDLEKARHHGRRCLELAPDFTVTRVAKKEPIRDPAVLERWLSALRISGIPEGS